MKLGNIRKFSGRFFRLIPKLIIIISLMGILQAWLFPASFRLSQFGVYGKVIEGKLRLPDQWGMGVSVYISPEVNQDFSVQLTWQNQWDRRLEWPNVFPDFRLKWHPHYSGRRSYTLRFTIPYTTTMALAVLLELLRRWRRATRSGTGFPLQGSTIGNSRTGSNPELAMDQHSRTES